MRTRSLNPVMRSASSKHDPCRVRTCKGTRRRHIQ